MNGDDGAADIAAPVLLMIAFLMGFGVWHEMTKTEPIPEDPFILVLREDAER